MAAIVRQVRKLNYDTIQRPPELTD